MGKNTKNTLRWVGIAQAEDKLIGCIECNFSTLPQLMNSNEHLMNRQYVVHRGILSLPSNW
jgi:hypothetical protein